MGRMLLWFTAGIAIALALFAAGDRLLWQQAAANGQGYDSVQVSRVSIASLKGSKEEYYADGTETVRCARSTFPVYTADAWQPPCWWQRRHRTIEVRY